MAKDTKNNSPHVLVLGIGNVLMGDEGIGVRVVEKLATMPLPSNVQCLDGGTGSFLLLEPMQRAVRVILIDATIDGQPAGTVSRLKPRFSSQYPATLTAHDIGLKDLLDAAYLIGGDLNVTLFAVSIDPPQGVDLQLSPRIAECVPKIAWNVMGELTGSRDTSLGARELPCPAGVLRLLQPNQL
jgi:hydrogenase maturation protease